jgi:hypothetical protein
MSCLSAFLSFRLSRDGRTIEHQEQLTVNGDFGRRQCSFLLFLTGSPPALSLVDLESVKQDETRR